MTKGLFTFLQELARDYCTHDGAAGHKMTTLSAVELMGCWVREKVLSREWKLELEQQQIDWHTFMVPWSNTSVPLPV